MKKKKLLVCGATGFIGRNIAEYFALMDNVEVYGTYLNSEPPDNKEIKMVRADLTVAVDVDKVIDGMDIIIQAAATTSGAKDIVSKPYYHVTDNAVMNSLILRAAYAHNVSHVLFFSCTVMYQSSETPVKESDFNADEALYPNYFGVGWTKIYIEKMCEFYSGIGKTKHTVIRHSNIYGPYDKFDLEKSHVFGATMTKVMTAEDGGSIVVWGNGEEERDLLYVSDLVDFVDNVIEKQESSFELFNVGCGSSVSVTNLVGKIISCSDKRIEIEHDLTKPTLQTKLCLNIAKAGEIIGWRPKVSFEEGIRKTMDWYESNIKIND